MNRVPLTAAVLDRLADGLPADADHLATTTGLDHDQVQQRITAAADFGYEPGTWWSVGAVPTLNPTNHQFTVRGHQIHLTIEPDGTVAHVDPANTHVAIVGPEIASGCDTTGPGSDVCTQMPFLSSATAGQNWLRGRTGIGRRPGHHHADRPRLRRHVLTRCPRLRAPDHDPEPTHRRDVAPLPGR